VLFLERDVPWYASNRDLPDPPFGRMELYNSVTDLRDRFSREIRTADLVIVGSYVPDGIEVGTWVCATAKGTTAFYDIDTPVTLAALQAGRCAYLSAPLVAKYQLYLSFTGGPTLRRLERTFGARMARPLYCSFDPAQYFPEAREPEWDLGYMGTFTPDRQPALQELLVRAAQLAPDLRFIVAGPGYPEDCWAPNIERVQHVAATDHRGFYTAQRFTLNLTRANMIQAGYSPSVRLFEAAACGVPIISDYWVGLETIFKPQSEILISASSAETARLLKSVPDTERRRIARRARRRVLADHTAEHRAEQLEDYYAEAAERGVDKRGRAVAAPATAEAGP
jgi:spore maturation protein CgeB